MTNSLTELAGLPALVDGTKRAQATFVFAHGAGAPMDHSFMTAIAQHVAAEGIRVVRFEFPYMAARRREGRRPGPDRQPVLLDAWRAIVAEVGGGSTVIGGKSMGGRMASMVADELFAAGRIAGLVCLGYPFHPTGRPEQLRTAHLEALVTPALIVQGERDTMGSRAEVEGYRLSKAIEVRWLPDGDHSFKPRKASGHTEAEHIAEAARLTAEFIRRVTASD